jgi:ornithine cyclodeaminase/alanine dehydrogenase-like protein (mu-crystallin family)
LALERSVTTNGGPYEGALNEAADLLDPLIREIITKDHIVGERADVVLDRVQGRTNEDQLTSFESVGTAIEDLALAYLVIDAAATNGITSDGPLPTRYKLG